MTPVDRRVKRKPRVRSGRTRSEGSKICDFVRAQCANELGRPAGIGRVSQHVLLPRFAAVELLEPSGAFLDKARTLLPPGRVAAYHQAALQAFVVEYMQTAVLHGIMSQSSDGRAGDLEMLRHHLPGLLRAAGLCKVAQARLPQPHG